MHVEHVWVNLMHAHAHSHVSRDRERWNRDKRQLTFSPVKSLRLDVRARFVFWKQSNFSHAKAIKEGLWCPTHSSFCAGSMAKRYTLLETLDCVLDSSETEDALEDSEPEDSEPEDCDPTEENTGLEEDEYQESEEDCEEGDADQTFTSKNGQITWSTTPPSQGPGRASAARVTKLTPGPTRYACSRVEDIKSSFYCFFQKASKAS